MKPIRTGLLAFSLIVLPFLAGVCLADSVQWLTYEEGVGKARQEGKKVFLHFYADWCTYCAQMDEKTFAESYVYSYLNKHFIPIKVNVDREPRIASQYRVQPIPDSWFLTRNTRRIAKRPGYIDLDSMILLLKYVHTDSYKKMSLPDFRAGQNP